MLKPFLDKNMPVPGTIVVTPKVRQNSFMSQEQVTNVMTRQLNMQFMPMLRARQKSAGLKPEVGNAGEEAVTEFKSGNKQSND